MLQRTAMQPSPLASWPIPGDAPDLLAIVQSQMATIEDQEALLHAYQGVLNTAQAPAPATGTGNAIASTTLTVTGSNGGILLGATITGAQMPTTPTTIVSQQSGTLGGDGNYTVSQALTLANAALTFTPGGGAPTWPVPRDAATLNTLVQMQTAVLRVQTALIQHYQDVLVISQTAAPPTGP